MFDDLIKQLKKLERTGVSVPVKYDEEGYFDRECPNKDCLFQFKVFGDDWTNLCKDEAIHCPLCGHQAPSKSWWTKEQIETANNQALGLAKAAISHGLSNGAKDFNRRQKPGLITMSIKYSGGPTHYTPVPIAAHEAMKLKIQCETCFTRFAVIGSAFFCPCCGKNSVERIFNDSLKKVEIKLDNLETVRSAIEDLSGKDAAELTCRSLIETSLSDCVVAFQKLMESLYMYLPNKISPSLNVFQRIDGGSTLWKQSCGEGYEDWLSQAELQELNILFHKRHLLAHTEGFIDERYLKKSGDNSYKIGQRVVIKEKDIRRLTHLIRILSAKARSKIMTEDLKAP